MGSRLHFGNLHQARSNGEKGLRGGEEPIVNAYLWFSRRLVLCMVFCAQREGVEGRA